MTIDVHATRKRTELRQRLASLDVEFDTWRALTTAGRLLQKHHSQVRLVTSRLEGLRDALSARLERVPDATLLGRARDLGKMILAGQAIWHFFRDKLGQRESAWFEPFLKGADEIAWACYQPALAAATTAAAAAGRTPPRREPPLVFLNAAWSPFVLPRGSAYQVDASSTWHEQEDFATVLRSLPFAVVGLPWSDAAWYPSTPVLAHEIGHAVEDDFGLTPTLRTVVHSCPVPKARQEPWQSWCGEVFADLWGVLSLGPAFVQALVDILADHPSRVAAEQRTPPDWQGYPTAWLRVQLATLLLGKSGYVNEAATLWGEWRARYPAHAMTEFEPDAAVVATALHDATWPPLGATAPRLAHVQSFTPAQARQANLVAACLLGEFPLDERDARVVAAGARLAFERDPAGYARARAEAELRRHLAALTPGGLRAEQQETAEADAQARTQAERLVGAALCARWLGEETGD